MKQQGKNKFERAFLSKTKLNGIKGFKSFTNKEPTTYTSHAMLSSEANLNILINDGQEVPNIFSEAKRSNEWDGWKKAIHT